MPPSRAADRFDLSIIIVNYNTSHLFEPLFTSLNAASDGLTVQTIVVDNASQDDSALILRTQHPDVILLANKENVGFARANNQALKLARGRYVLLLNTDAFVSPETLRKTVEYMDAHQECGVLGAKLVGPDKSLQPSCRYFPTPWNLFLAKTGLSRYFPKARLVDDFTWDHGSVRECDWVPGCYYLIRCEVLDQIGLFDPRYFMYSEEIDHCRAVRNAGWRVIYYPFTEVVHLGGESAKSVGQLTAAGRQLSHLQIESELLYFRKHHGLLGVLISVVLRIAAAATSSCKLAFGRTDLDRTQSDLKNVKQILRALLRTRLGAHPTR